MVSLHSARPPRASHTRPPAGLSAPGPQPHCAEPWSGPSDPCPAPPPPGLLVHGLSLLCFSALRPFAEPRREVEIHRQYVAQSVQLFILYFFNLAVLSTYLPQDTLKLLPLLTGLFAVSR